METPQQVLAALEQHRDASRQVTLNALFAQNPQRGEQMRVCWEGLVYDYAKHRVDECTLALLHQYARACKIEEWTRRMFAGENINISEQRPVLHTHQRKAASQRSGAEAQSWHLLARWVQSIHDGTRTGVTGRALRHVVNIGIGGSSVGPALAIEALRADQTPLLDVSFLTSLDVVARRQMFAHLNPEETLFVVVSKSFDTQETLLNARFARDWLVGHLGDKAVQHHFAAVSARPEKMREFGLPEDVCFSFPEGVGGRYSLWSPAGVTIALTLGMDVFMALREGAALADDHFATAPATENIPLLMGLIGFWYRSLLGYRSQAVVSYSRALNGFVPWLQQLEMESNGKQVSRTGEVLMGPTGPVIFGGIGTDVQHTFFQMIHQGVDVIPVDFIAIAHPPDDCVASADDLRDHRLLLANCLAQSQALMCGRPQQDVELGYARNFTGNRPSATFLLERLTPVRLGQLLALYEHKVFVQGCLWNINSFDQWGVELGKVLALKLARAFTEDDDNSGDTLATPVSALASASGATTTGAVSDSSAAGLDSVSAGLDSSTRALIRQCRRWLS